MRRRSSPLVASLPPLLAANRPVHARYRSRVAHTVRKREDEFALEHQVWIWSLGLVFCVEWLWGSLVSFFSTPLSKVAVLQSRFSMLSYAKVTFAVRCTAFGHWANRLAAS